LLQRLTDAGWTTQEITHAGLVMINYHCLASFIHGNAITPDLDLITSSRLNVGHIAELVS
jgi:hypothetical protein